MQIYKRLLTTFFFSSLIISLAACGSTGGQTAGGTPTTPPAPTSSTTPSIPSPVATQPTEKPASTPLVAIRMLDAANGWALTNNAVLKTSDGGIHWKVVTTLPAISLPPNAAFMDNASAWITFHEASAIPGVFTLLHTSDGGASWQKVTIQDPSSPNPYDGIDRPHFISTQEGWVTTGQAEGMHHSSMTLFHTTDGGLHWNLIASTAPQSQSGLPDSGNKTGISFKDSQTGWATAEIPAVYSWLYITNDGGKTWQQQKLAPPSEVAAAEQIGEFITTPPVLFGNDGLMPVLIGYQGLSGIDLYVTHDGGKTWTPTRLTQINSENVYVLDMQHVLASDKTGFYSTSDGGNSWTKLSQPSTELGALSFVSANVGWSISTSENKAPLLMHTTNGGRTWQTIAYYIA